MRTGIQLSVTNPARTKASCGGSSRVHNLCPELSSRSKSQVAFQTKRFGLTASRSALKCVAEGPRGGDIQFEPGDFGAREARPDEIESNFNSKCLGHADTDHIVSLPEAGRALFSLDCRECTKEKGDILIDSIQQEVYRKQCPNWVIEEQDGVPRLVRELKVKDFPAGLEVLRRVGDVAEAQGHHPDLHLHGWNNVKLSMWSHSAGGLTENDFIVAARINAIDLKDLIKEKKKRQRFWA